MPRQNSRPSTTATTPSSMSMPLGRGDNRSTLKRVSWYAPEKVGPTVIPTSQVPRCALV